MKKLVSILLILVLVFSMSAFALADPADVVSPEKGNTNVDNNNPNPSPQTGDTNTIFFVVAAMVLAIGAAVFCGSKLIREKFHLLVIAFAFMELF